MSLRLSIRLRLAGALASGILAGSPSALAEQLVSKEAVRQIYTSSTAAAEDSRPYSPKHLLDGRDWSAWGSDREDAAGAWIELVFDRVQYISGLEFVPGDARGKEKFEACGRPARIRISAGDQVITRRLSDERWRQRISFSTPLYGPRLKIEILATHGRSRAAGVCVSELKLRTPSGRLSTLPHLRRRLEAMAQQIEAGHPVEAIEAEALAIGAPAAPTLLRLIDLSRPGHTVKVIQILGALGDRATAGPLEDLYRDAKAPQVVRDRALWALGALGQRRHLDAIKRWHQGAYGGDRDLALDAWGRLGDPEALPEIFSALAEGTTPSRHVAVELVAFYPAAEIFAGLQPILDAEQAEARSWALRALARLDHPERDARILDALASEEPLIVEAGLLALLDVPLPQAHDQLKALTRHGAYPVRAAALRALSRQGAPRDLPLLIAGSRDPVPLVQQAAAEALARHAHRGEARRALEALALAPVNAPAARIAAEALAQGARADDLVPLLAASHPQVRGAAAAALERLGGEGHDALLAALASPDQTIRRGGIEALRRGDRVPVVDIIRITERATPTVQVDLLSLLATLEDPAASTLARRLVTPDHALQVRQAAMVALGRCGHDAQTQSTLIKALSDPAPLIQHAAVLALGERRAAEAVLPLGELLISTPQPHLRHAVVQALGNIGAPEALSHLTQAYLRHQSRGAEDPDLRAMIVLSASRIGGTESMRLLVEAVGDRDPRVRQAAERGLTRE